MVGARAEGGARAGRAGADAGAEGAGAEGAGANQEQRAGRGTRINAEAAITKGAQRDAILA